MPEAFRGTGKTTRLFEQAVQALAALPDNERVYITGAHQTAMRRLEHDFKGAGLVDVVFVSPHQIRTQGLRGARGVLLIDDYYDLTLEDQAMMDVERLLIRR